MKWGLVIKDRIAAAQIEKCDVTIRTLKSYRESATKLLSNNGIIYGYSYLYFCNCWFVLDFWEINLEKFSSMNWISSLFQTWFLLPLQPSKIND